MTDSGDAAGGSSIGSGRLASVLARELLLRSQAGPTPLQRGLPSSGAHPSVCRPGRDTSTGGHLRSCRPSGAHHRARAAVRSPSVRRRVRARLGLSQLAPPRSRSSRPGRPRIGACVGASPSRHTSFASTPKRRGHARAVSARFVLSKKGRKKGRRELLEGATVRWDRCGRSQAGVHRLKMKEPGVPSGKAIGGLRP
jgi:hypothetical protein